jgi:hypothetical protein
MASVSTRLLLFSIVVDWTSRELGCRLQHYDLSSIRVVIELYWPNVKLCWRQSDKTVGVLAYVLLHLVFSSRSDFGDYRLTGNGTIPPIVGQLTALTRLCVVVQSNTFLGCLVV